MRLHWLRCVFLIYVYGLIFMIEAHGSNEDGIEIEHQEPPVKNIVLEGQDHLELHDEEMDEHIEGAGDGPLGEGGHAHDGLDFTGHEHGSHERGGHEHDQDHYSHEHGGHGDTGRDHGDHVHDDHEHNGHEHDSHEHAGHEDTLHEHDAHEHEDHDHDDIDHEEDVEHIPIDDHLLMDEDFHYEDDHHMTHDHDHDIHDLDAEQVITPQPHGKKQVPDVTMINKFLFLEKLMNSGTNFLINLGALGCDKCQLFYEEYRMVLHYLHDTKQNIDAYLLADKNLLDEFSFEKFEYPVVLYYRAGVPVIYNGDLTATSLQHWVASNSKRTSMELTDNNFQHLVAVNDDRATQWLVLFCIMSDPKCWRPLALTETLATTTSMVNIGTVDISTNKALSQKLPDAKHFPSWLLFREHDTIELHFYDRLTVQHIEDVYKETSLTLSEKISRAVLQVRSVMMWTGAFVTGGLLLLCIICRKIARIGERDVKKGV